MNPTIESLRLQLQQLQARHAAGQLNDAAYTEARSALERALVDQLMADGTAATMVTPAPRKLQAALTAGVLLLAALGYSFTGTPERLLGRGTAAPDSAQAPAADGRPAMDDAQVADIVERVAQRLKDKPDDPVGWALLARAYAAMGRLADASEAFGKALALSPDDASLLADQADTLAALNNGQLPPEALKLVERALKVEPGNLKALALAGSAAFDRRDYAQAVRLWEQVERGLPPDSEILTPVRASIVQARELGGLPPATVVAGSSAPAAVRSAPLAAAGPATPASAAVGSTASSAASSAVSGRITLAAALAGRAAPEDTVFVLARAANGPRMPLAVLRKQVKDLPLAFSLDDSMAMAPTARISDHAQVIVSVRISKSGDAMPQNGDLSGQSAPVAPGTRGLSIQISEVLSR